MAQQNTDVFVRLERFYDAVPRSEARTEDFGGLVLFVREGPGWPFYARPRLGASTPSAADITATRQRQRDLGCPEAFEWVHETTPDLLAVARSAGLEVLLAPLLILDPAALIPDLPVSGARIRFLDPDSPNFAADLGAARAVAQLGFGTPTSASPISVDGPLTTETAGPRHRDAVSGLTDDQVEAAARQARAGRQVTGVVEAADEGILCSGVVQIAEGVAEVAGVATLPSARKRGYASQLTANLSRHAITHGAEMVFLSAGDDDVARLYSRVGFRRIGTACIGAPAAAAL